MIQWHALAAVICYGTAFGVNLYMKPTLDRQVEASVLTMQTGKLVLDVRGKNKEFPLITVQLHPQDVRNFNRVRQVRELWLRGPQTGDSAPVLDVYGVFPNPPGVDVHAHPPLKAFRGVEMKIVESGFEGQPSYLDLGGAEQPARVVDGTLRLSQILPTSDGGVPTWRVRGRISLLLETEGGEDLETVEGRIEARVVWN